MTKSQEASIQMLKEHIESMHGEYSDRYELKTWEVEDQGYKVFVSASLGLKGDEGTYASLCRDYFSFFIGKRGAITYPVCRKLKNGEYKSYTKTYYNIWTALADQQ